jgi:hypothetical protein
MIHFEEKVQIFELNILMEVLDKTAKKIWGTRLRKSVFVPAALKALHFYKVNY